ncbi:argininosuccinate lyase [Vibrio ouci]|uniref:Argininosuccinate lyase n=1 Tax=Vibrio ouci TaxID=2499078 RepID=A0A4Y8WKP1_9VIBR|nr:argininosuccinate lyase [Vibrio ouci]TFH92848.1 argininosuccinate lyase [Vibrio ouci]
MVTENKQKTQKDDANKSNPLWGGRFSTSPGKILEEVNSSVHFDYKLAQQDIAGSIAHARMLKDCAIITSEDFDAIAAGLNTVKQEIEDGEFVFKPELEDVHMNIEHRLSELIGPVAGKLHTARSRNDQVAVDSKMWVRKATDELDQLLANTVEILVDKALVHHADIMPGFTHLQCAQPVTLGHHLLAYAEMFLRDRYRLQTNRCRLNQSPLGAAALAGTSHPIDLKQTATELWFRSPMRNSLDAVSDRDFILDYLYAASVIAMHLSRLGEEFVIWSTPQFGFIQLPEELTAGSSIMPQKRNPDAAELIRAKSGRIYGNLVSLLVVLKSLPLAYSRDMQEDKEPLFDTAQTITNAVKLTNAMLSGFEAFPEKMQADAILGNTCATDLADWLVKERDLPFRESHHLIGRLVKWLEQQDKELKDAHVEDLVVFNDIFSGIKAEILTVRHSVESRNSFGGTSPTRVRESALVLAVLNSQIVTSAEK